MLMPQLVEMMKTAPDTVDWSAAPLRALPAPAAPTAAVEVAPVVNGSEPPPSVPEAAIPEPGSAHGTPKKPDLKRARRSQRGDEVSEA